MTTASASNPYLIKIEPGTYDVGPTPLALKSWVTVEGSGIRRTTILGEGVATLNAYNTTRMYLSNLKVENRSGLGSGTTQAIWVQNASGALIQDVLAYTSGSATNGVGLRISNFSVGFPNVTVERSSIVAQAPAGHYAAGIYLESDATHTVALSLLYSFASGNTSSAAGDGITTTSSSQDVNVDWSELSGSTYSIAAGFAHPRIGFSFLDAPVATYGGGTLVCGDSLDGKTYAALSTTCT